MRKLSVIALALFLFILLSILLSTLVYAQPSTGGGGGGGSGGSATNLAGGTANAVPYQSAPGVTTFLPQGTGVWYESAGAPFYTLTPALTSVNGTSATSSVTIQGGADAASSSVLGGILLRGGSQTGTGSTNSAGGGIDVSGGNNAGTSGTSQAGSVELEAGESTAGGQQGLMILGYQMTEGIGTVTQWNLQCYTSASRMTVLDCPANPTDFVGVTDYHSGSATEVHIPPSESPINASAPVTLYDTVCAGAAAGQVTDSGGTGPCSTGITVGRVIAVSGTWTLADGASFTASSTLPLVAMTNRSQLGQGDVPTAGTPPGWTITGGSGLSQVVTLPGSIGASGNCQNMNTSNSLCLTSSPYYGSPAGSVTTTTTATLANTATTIAVTSCSTFTYGNGVLVGTAYGNSFLGTVSSCTGGVLTFTSAVSGLSGPLSSGATVQHDETAAFLAAFTALTPLGGTIYLPGYTTTTAGTYLANGPLLDTSGANAVLPFPKQPNYTGNTTVISIKGFDVPYASPIIQTSLNTAGNLFGGYDSATGGGYPDFTNVIALMDNVQIVGPTNIANGVTMINATWLLGFEFPGHLIISTTGGTHGATSAGLLMPTVSNNLFLGGGDLEVVGFGIGVRVGEHSQIQHILTSGNSTGVQFDAAPTGGTYANFTNAATVQQIWCAGSTGNCIGAGANATTIDVRAVNLESVTTEWINDPSNLLHGVIGLNKPGATCPISSPQINGGVNLNIIQLQCGQQSNVIAQTLNIQSASSAGAVKINGSAGSAGQVVGTNGTIAQWVTPVLGLYQPNITINPAQATSGVVYAMTVPTLSPTAEVLTLPANCTGSTWDSIAANSSAGSTTFTIAKNGSTVCTGTIAASGSTLTWGTGGSATTLTSGDVIAITYSGDASNAGGLTLAGSHN